MLTTFIVLVSVLAGFALGFYAAKQRTSEITARAQHNAIAVLSSPNVSATLELILAEAERRRTAKATPR